MKFRSNIPEYSKAVFNCFNEEGKPTFYERAMKVRDGGMHGIIIAGESYGQGSSREHAAICPTYLGIKIVIAKSFERIHKDNLVNFGILPLTFATNADYEKVNSNDEIKIENIREQLKSGNVIRAKISFGEEIKLKHDLTSEQVETILAGGILNQSI